MVNQVFTLPLRITLKTTGLVLRGARGATESAWQIGTQLIGAASANRSERAAEGPQQPTSQPKPAPRPVRADPRRAPAPNGAPPEPKPRRAQPPAPASPEVDFDRPAPLVPGSGHISTSEELVDERADPGAEDGAGAQVNVKAPWPGYGEMSTDELVARVEQSNPAELLAVKLYETSHRGRDRVLAAVDERLGRID